MTAKMQSHSIKSRVAAVSVPLKEGMEKARGGWGVRALQVAAMASAMFAGVGLGVSFFLDRHKNSMVAEKQKEVLADYYRNQVAAQLGMDPSKVSAKDLELAAKVNPMFAQAIAKVKHEEKDSNRANLLATGGAAAVGGALVPGLSGAAYLAAHGAGAVAGSLVSTVFDADVLHTQDMMEHINGKRVSGQKITASDIAMLRISQDEELQKQLKKQNGKAFHKMTEEQQHAIARTMPNLSDAAEMAERINNGLITEQDVLMAAPAQGKWAKMVGGSRGIQGSFVSKVNTERAAQGVNAAAL